MKTCRVESASALIAKKAQNASKATTRTIGATCTTGVETEIASAIMRGASVACNFEELI